MAAKQLNEIKKSRVGFQPQLVKPKAPSPLEQLTVLATCSLTDLPRHIEKIGQLSSQLGDAANDQLRQVTLRVAAAPDGSKLLTHVLKQMREQSSIDRVTMIVELAPINEATRVVVRDELIALCTRNTTVMPVPAAVRSAALDAFWKLGDFSPLFEGPQQNDLVLLFRPEGAVRSGLFRSREEIKTFVQNVVLPYHDRIAAFGVLAAFRWHRLLSVPTFRNEFTQVEPEFAALIQRCSLEEIDQISLADANNFYILIEVIRLYSIGSERADRLLTRICSSIPERDDVSETLAVAALKMVGQQQMQIAEALLNSGHFKWAAVLTVGALDFVEQSREQKLQDLGKGLVDTSEAVREILDLCGTAVGLTPFEQAGYSILDRLPLSNLRAIYLFVNGRLQGNSANKRTLGERHPWIKPMQYLWDRMNRRES